MDVSKKMPTRPKMAVNSVPAWFLVFASCIAAGFAGSEEVVQMRPTWGMINVSLPCLPEDKKFDPETGICYWKYVGANGESTELHRDFYGTHINMTTSSHLGSQNELVLHRVDWNSTGLYICDYSPSTESSFSKTTINVTVTAPFAIIEECDSSETRNKSERCRISPKSAQMVNITCSKKGLLDPEAFFRPDFGTNVYLSEDRGRREFLEKDGSTSIVHRFEVGVDKLKSEGEFTCVLVDKMRGISIEEVSAVIQPRTDVQITKTPENQSLQTGPVSTSVAAVVVPVVICGIIIALAWFVYRYVRKRRSQPAPTDV